MKVKERSDGSVIVEFATDDERRTYLDRFKRMAAASTQVRTLDRALATSDLGAATKRALVHRDQRLRDIDARYGLLTSSQVAERRGSTSKNSAQVVADLRGNYLTPTIQRGNRRLMPGFVFTERGAVHEWVRPVCQALAGIGFDEESQVFWLTSPNTYLDDATPLDALTDATPASVERVLHAVRQRAAV